MSDTRKPFPHLTFLIAPQLCCAFIVALRHSFLVRISFITCYLALLAYGVLSEAYTTGSPMQDFGIGGALASQWFTFCYLLLIVEQPLENITHEKDQGKPVDLPLLKRVYRQLCHINGSRSVGWSDQIKNLPPTSTLARWSFVLTRVLRVFEYLLVMDLTQAYLHLPANVSGQSIATYPYIHRCLHLFSYGASGYALLSIQYEMLAGISVALGSTEAKSWPRMFGNWSDAYTVRNLWGKVWHQMLRRALSSIGKSITALFGIKPGSSLSSNAQLIVVFTLSGLTHTYGDALTGLQHTGESFLFFFAQPFAIIFEDLVIALYRGAIGSKTTPAWGRLIGYAWVWVWFSISLPWFLDWTVRAGIGAEGLLPFSLHGPADGTYLTTPAVQWLVDYL